jgi:hypothetical protein
MKWFMKSHWFQKQVRKWTFSSLRNSEMMPQICRYHEHTKYGYAQRLFLKQPQSYMKHELGQGHKDVMISKWY